MKTLEKQIKKLALFLSFLILVQGCTVYKGKGLTLDDAIYSNSKSEVITNYDMKMKFKRIILEDGNYYGLKKVKGDLKKTTLNPSDIKKVRIKDKTLSTVLSILVPIVTLTLIGLAIPNSSPRTYYLDGPLFQ